MSIVLGPHQYGKAETRLVRIVRDSPRHEITDLNVSSALRGPWEEAYLDGDQRRVLPTDTQKNSAYVWAKKVAPDPIEVYGLALAHHFVDDVEPVEGARVEIERYDWTRVEVDGRPHDHTFVRTGQEVRTAAITLEADATHVVQGFKDLVVLKSTGSHFKDFLVDEYTTLQPTDDRIMATSLTAQWRLTDAAADTDWNGVYAAVKALMLAEFATLDSFALQQTLWHMGRAALEAFPPIAEIRLVAPNKHHFLVDFSRFDEPNENEVFHADDRPYGLIQASAVREGAAPAGEAWHGYTGLV
ncbi:factor-independent urate hydroxylase [Amnibacterium setariae]|uniref:Uricase n=1 Tax=Amnibacterium setariae TaxID=2306585 RepID=A0A3A1TTM3_9MICO|nr:urate oxidase [Amnibacterium setariae]RIX26431.1 urate oxidase [Amnibacterium setariae]